MRRCLRPATEQGTHASLRAHPHLISHDRRATPSVVCGAHHMVFNTDVTELSFPRELEPFDHLMLRSEQDPRGRSGFLAVSLLEAVPEFEQIRATYDRASRVVVRLRQKVVVPSLPVASPQWVIDPDFDLEFHVRRVVLPPPGRLRDLLDYAQPLLAAPFDLARPLWELHLVEGLREEGQAAILMKTHHAVMDGMAAV